MMEFAEDSDSDEPLVVGAVNPRRNSQQLKRLQTNSVAKSNVTEKKPKRLKGGKAGCSQRLFLNSRAGVKGAEQFSAGQDLDLDGEGKAFANGRQQDVQSRLERPSSSVESALGARNSKQSDTASGHSQGDEDLAPTCDEGTKTDPRGKRCAKRKRRASAPSIAGVKVSDKCHEEAASSLSNRGKKSQKETSRTAKKVPSQTTRSNSLQNCGQARTASSLSNKDKKSQEGTSRTAKEVPSKTTKSNSRKTSGQVLSTASLRDSGKVVGGVSKQKRGTRTCTRTDKRSQTSEDHGQTIRSSSEDELLVGHPSDGTVWFEQLQSSNLVKTDAKEEETEGVALSLDKVEPASMSEADSDEELLDPSLSLDEEYEVGDLVWAKHPWTLFWPAKVVDICLGRQTKITVEYFHPCHDLFTCQYSIRAIRQFSLENRKIMSEGYCSESSTDFRAAVEEAMEYLENQALCSSPAREPPTTPIHCPPSLDSPPLTPTEVQPPPVPVACSSPGDYDSPPSPELVTGHLSGSPEPTDPQKDAQRAKMKAKWARVEDRLIRYIMREDTKERLLKIWEGKINSERHKAFFSTFLKERLRLKYRGQIGPLSDERIDEVTGYLGKVFGEHCQVSTEALPNTAYIFDVWLPEAVVYATCKSRRVGQKKAAQLLSLEGLQAYKDLELI